MSSRPVALVTGGARRIGRAIALELARGGHDIAVHVRDAGTPDAEATAAMLEAAGARATVLVADLADEAACERLLPQAVERLGRVDVLVNNASLFVEDDVSTLDYAALARHWQVNAGAPVLLARALERHLRARDPEATGCVVNLLDQKLWNPNPDYFSYTLSKAALREATVLLAMACAPRLRVAAVAPGVTLPSDLMTEAQFAAAHRMTPLGRSSTAEDIARAVRFLVESPAITGHTLLVDGGQHLERMPRDVVYLAREIAPQ